MKILKLKVPKVSGYFFPYDAVKCLTSNDISQFKEEN